MTPSGIIALVVVGLASGWIASRIVTGRGTGLVASLVVGVLGAFIGPLLLNALGIREPVGILGSIVTAVIGAGALLFIAQVVGSLALVLIGALVVILLLGGASVRWR